MEINFQKITSNCADELEVARKYYHVLFGLNNIHVTKKELDLVAFSAIYGSISTPGLKEEFTKQFKAPLPSIYNMIGRLKKLNIFVKESGKYNINPVIYVNFLLNPNIVLAVKINKVDGSI